MRINPLTRELTMTEEEYHKCFADDSKLVEDDFEKEYMAFMNSEEFLNAGNKKAYMLARHFAEWQKKRFEAEYELDWITDLKKDLYELGRKDMRAQMMEKAVEGEVVKDISNKLAVTAKINLAGFKFGQKVKIIILKDDE